jgi:hypothetical protein
LLEAVIFKIDMEYFLPKTSVKKIDAAIEALFARMKARFLGKKPLPKEIRFSVTGLEKPIQHREDFSMPGLFDKAAEAEGMKPNPQLKNAMASSIEQYLDAHKELAKAKIKNTVQSFLSESELAKEKPDVAKVLGAQLKEVMQKVSADVQTVVDNEMQKSKNVSSLDAISKVTASVGVEDPTIVFIGPNDAHTCKDCKRLFFLEDGVTPRAWKMSELKQGYGKHGDTVPTVGSPHPFCRHATAAMMPGFGFKNGKIEYIEPGYDVWKEQRG